MNINRYNRIFASALAISGLAITTPAWSALNLSSNPLFLTTGADPNIMFILDDSGSMQFEIMPDQDVFFNSGRAPYVFPIANDVYGGSDYGNRVPTVDSNDPYNARTRSPQINKIYYNPAVTYTPWSKEDGTLYPDADPSAAYHNPEDHSVGTRDLKNYNTEYARWISCNSSGTCPGGWSSETFWPATYYIHTGGDAWTWSNFTRVEIRPSTTTYTGEGRSNRTDCAAASTCTYDEEIQNFANWYTYYRSRILASRAAIGRAFSQQPENIRVGFGTINTWNTVIDGVRPFANDWNNNNSLDYRSEFFDNLYSHDIPARGTPLRRALDDVGGYFINEDAAWDGVSCRQSYSILTTDGYWSGGNSYDASGDAKNNNDGTDGPTITGPNSASYTYDAVAPFSDNRSDTLADVAMYYWKNDLRTDLTNNVPPNSDDPAFWQHMVTFGVGLGVTGSIDWTTATDAVKNNTTINWPDPDENSTNCSGSSCDARLDDLLHAALNSRGDFFSAQNPQEFADALNSSLAIIASRGNSASAITSNSTRLDTDTKIYQARFNSTDWTGELTAYNIDETDGSVGKREWRASKNIPSANNRNIFTLDSSNSSGVTFEWGSLSATQKTQLHTNILGSNDGLGQERLNYLRGDQSGELKNNSGSFRNRSSVLGDIINSDPLYVGTSDYGYALLSGTEGTDYVTYRDSTAYKNRIGMIYFGANDGMLHALNADNGTELFTYVPNFVFPELSKLTSPDYAHRYYVDGSPRAGDAYINSAWRTVLLGSAGAGGRGIFALDVTHPGSFDASDVMWEYTHTDLGYTIGQPTIVRLNDDSWAAMFGNGYNSDNHEAILFLVDLASGNLITAINTGVGDSASPNGLATPVPVDVNGDRITDYVYAGDLQGNLWKFDLTGSSDSQWKIAFKQGNTFEPLFTAADGSGNAQPITIRPAVGSHPDGGRMIYFGTGKYIETGDNIVGANPQVQTFYGIRDDDSNQVTGRNKLQAQTISAEIDAATAGFNSDIRVISDNTVDWNNKQGWYLDLESPVNGPEGERVISDPLLRHGRIIFPTVTPSADVCDSGGSSWLMEMNAVSGARLAYSVFDLDGDGDIDQDDFGNLSGTDLPVSGRRSNEGMIDTPAIISAGEKEYKYTSGSTGGFEVITEKGSSVRGRQSWRQLK